MILPKPLNSQSPSALLNHFSAEWWQQQTPQIEMTCWPRSKYRCYRYSYKTRIFTETLTSGTTKLFHYTLGMIVVPIWNDTAHVIGTSRGYIKGDTYPNTGDDNNWHMDEAENYSFRNNNEGENLIFSTGWWKRPIGLSHAWTYGNYVRAFYYQPMRFGPPFFQLDENANPVCAFTPIRCQSEVVKRRIHRHLYTDDMRWSNPSGEYLAREIYQNGLDPVDFIDE